ncbi:MAG: polyprenyl synthetase family protein, partial [Oscillospiraceae bacterium]|nr:polyprenyl synthetase family protein [Oscillospiraceae bacterium]
MNFEEYKALIDKSLEAYFKFDDNMPHKGLADAMRYSLLAGGKRIRPILVLEFCRICGGNIEEAIPVACAIEMLHTYSLIHDDLPCMDNDELRRGMPTNHMVYGECTATLAGDTLQAEAFGTILRSELSVERRAACACILADSVGLDGMCGGQYLDMSWEGRKLSEQELTDINSRKTGALLVAACQMGVAAAGGSELMLASAGHYGAALGMAFQIRDDMLDV